MALPNGGKWLAYLNTPAAVLYGRDTLVRFAQGRFVSYGAEANRVGVVYGSGNGGVIVDMHDTIGPGAVEYAS